MERTTTQRRRAAQHGKDHGPTVAGDDDKRRPPVPEPAAARQRGKLSGQRAELIDYVVQNFYHDTIIRAQSGGHVLNKEAATFSER